MSPSCTWGPAHSCSPHCLACPYVLGEQMTQHKARIKQGFLAQGDPRGQIHPVGRSETTRGTRNTGSRPSETSPVARYVREERASLRRGGKALSGSNTVTLFGRSSQRLQGQREPKAVRLEGSPETAWQGAPRGPGLTPWAVRNREGCGPGLTGPCSHFWM